MRISKNFTKEEFELSRAAIKGGLDNTIPQRHLPNLNRLIWSYLQPFRDYVRKAIFISSGYRSPAVNTAIGGSESSYHKHCLAVDPDVAGLTPMQTVRKLVEWSEVSGMVFDKIILEYDSWVHIQIAKEGKEPRGQVLQASFKDGLTHYSFLKLENK